MQTTVDADAVSVHGGNGDVVGKRSDGALHVRTDSGDRDEKIRIGREFAIIVFADVFGAAL